MRLGCCAGFDRIEQVKQAGFDFMEVNVQAVLRGEVDDAEWAAAAPAVDTLALPIEAANCLVPGSLPIVGPKRDLPQLRTYMARVAERAGRLGIRRLVLGSGGARRRPDETAEAEAMDQLVEFARLAGDACASHGIVLVIEHLRQQETNTINTLAQMHELVDRADHPQVLALVDTYHFGVEDDSEEALVALGDRIAHVHLAEPAGRVEPGAAGDGAESFDFVHFFSLLRKTGYDQRLSIEAKLSGPIEQAGPAAVRFIRTSWEQASGVGV
ncbi:MAG: sugar phosphate isomerase/epimerase family protein [Phycisphaeraceae bacterium]